MFSRVVIKLSGEALAGSCKGFDDGIINRIIDEIKQAMNLGVNVAIVVGGGNFWRGRSAKPEMDNVAADQIGMMATVMNGLYLAEAFRLNGITAKVMTPFSVGTFTELFQKQRALEYFREGKAIIFAGGTGHPFFSTDSIVALRANELEADCVIYAKNVDGVYNANPSVNKDARKYKRISYRKVIADNLDAADITAMQLSTAANIPSVVFELKKEGSILAALSGFDEIYKIGGTLIANEIKEEFYV